MQLRAPSGGGGAAIQECTRLVPAIMPSPGVCLQVLFLYRLFVLVESQIPACKLKNTIPVVCWILKSTPQSLWNLQIVV